MRIIVFGGWFGSRNVGDDAILIGLKNAFSKVSPEMDIVALSTDPKYTRTMCGVDAIPLLNPIRTLSLDMHLGKMYLDAFKNADACVVSGGTPIYDYDHLSRSLHIGLPSFLRKRIFYFGIGVRSIESALGKLLIKRLMRNSNRISTRDEPSKYELTKLGIMKPVSVTGDSALFVKPVIDESVTKIFEANCIDKRKPMIAIFPRLLSENYRMHYHEFISIHEILKLRRNLAMFADYMLDAGYEVVFIPMHCVPSDNDLFEINAIIRFMKRGGVKIIKGNLRSDEVLAIIDRMQLVFGLRLHSLIFAAMQSVPVLSVDYDVKLRGFMELIDARDFLLEKTVSPQTLISKAEQAIDSTRDLRKIFQSNCEVMKQRIMKEVEYLLQ